MKRLFAVCAFALASFAVTGFPGFLHSGPAAAAQTTGSMPVFEVDPAWPKVPPKWKLGDPSSIAIDAKDNVWVLHRPRTLKPDEAAMAAPPVMVFDSAGNFIKLVFKGMAPAPGNQ